MNGSLLIALIGVAAAVLLVFGSLRAAVIDAPRDDRSYKDRPPALWRLCWPVVEMLARWPGSALALASRTRTLDQLRRAGLDLSLNPEQFLAGRLVAGLLACLMVSLAWVGRGQVPPPAWPVLAFCVGYLLPLSWLKDKVAARGRRVLREIPFYLDVLTLALESGLNLTAAMNEAIDKGPVGPLRQEFIRVMRDLRAGRTRAEALRGMSERLGSPAVASLVSALLTAERQGASLGKILRAQAEQRRSERFLRAERQAMEAPVKMLLPLVLFIFPCTFLTLFFPVFSRLLQEGWLK